MPISKTDFVRALQCEKMLWLDSHVPEQKIVPPEIQAKLDAGNEFGDKAMGIFGPFIETTTLREDGRLHFSAMIEKNEKFARRANTRYLRSLVFLVWQFLRSRYPASPKQRLCPLRSQKRL